MIRIIDDFLDDSDIIKYTKFIEQKHKRQSVIKDELNFGTNTKKKSAEILGYFLSSHSQKISGH